MMKKISAFLVLTIYSFYCQALSFSDVQREIFNPKCVMCHLQYENYGAIRRELNEISAAVETNRMPKIGGPLSEDQKQMLRNWIAAEVPPESVQLEANWKSISENIVNPRCLVCHNPRGQAQFLDLSTREAFIKNKDRLFGSGQKLINETQPELSYLIEIVKDDVEPMPPRWSNIRRLNTDEINILMEWIGKSLP